MSNLRISGLASGMDTDAMVQSLMRVERLKVDRFEQNKQIALWRQEAYTNMNKMFANFILNTKKDMGLTKISSTGIALGTSYSKLDYVKKATSSNETVATVSSTSEAVNGNFELDVKSLAKGASFTSKKLGDDILKDESGDKLKSLSFKINGKTIAVGNGSKEISMEDVTKAINAKKDDTGVTAFYDKANNRLFMQTTETGKDAKIDIGGDFAGKLGFTGMEEDSYTDDTGAKYIQGKNAEVLFNGVKLEYSSNRFTLNGVNVELKDVGKVNVKVDTNVEGIMDKVKKLIADYNELVDKASMAVNEKRYESYKPLSMEEKKAMHEDDVKLWEEKARSGMLSKDETMQRVLQNVRTDLYKTVEGVAGKFNHITQIGITTERYARGATGGKLEIDEEKLRKAIMEDPEGVMELLFKEGKYTDKKDSRGNPIEDIAGDKAKFTTKGVFTGIYDNLISGMKSIIDKSGPGQDSDLLRNVKSNILIDFVTNKSSISDIDKEVRDMNKRIDDLNDMLVRKENAYYSKFGQMEKMLQQMYSQSNWLSQQTMR